MPKKKQPFTFTEHKQVGDLLRQMHRDLVSLAVKISKHYPIPLANKCGRVEDVLFTLRSTLDNRFFAEHGKPSDSHERNKELFKIYFS